MSCHSQKYVDLRVFISVTSGLDYTTSADDNLTDARRVLNHTQTDRQTKNVFCLRQTPQCVGGGGRSPSVADATTRTASGAMFVHVLVPRSRP